MKDTSFPRVRAFLFRLVYTKHEGHPRVNYHGE